MNNKIFAIGLPIAAYFGIQSFLFMTNNDRIKYIEETEGKLNAYVYTLVVEDHKYNRVDWLLKSGLRLSNRLYLDKCRKELGDFKVKPINPSPDTLETKVYQRNST